MKTITIYVCEICGRRSEDSAMIQDCESLGRPSIPAIGTVYRTAFCGKNITLAVAEGAVNGHHLDLSAWAARDNGAGDTLPESNARCYSSSSPDEWLPPDREHPTYKRLTEALLKAGIVPVDFERIAK